MRNLFSTYGCRVTHTIFTTHARTPPPPSYFNTEPNNFFPGITNRWFDTTIDETYYHLRFFPQQVGRQQQQDAARCCLRARNTAFVVCVYVCGVGGVCCVDAGGER